MLSETAAIIDHRLAALTPENGHHLFEHLCRAYARAVITPNVRASTGPVSAGGDLGVDFQTFQTFQTYELSPPDSSDETSGSSEKRFWLAAAPNIAFACSLDKDVRRKIREDVSRIAEHPRSFTRIVAFSSQNIQEKARVDLQSEVLDETGIKLEILDRMALAERLACEDVIGLARRYLSLPAHFVPDPVAVSMAPVVLPALDVSGFRGREDQLQALRNQLIEGPDAAVGVWGGPGTGKSALAVTFAQQSLAEFPGGVFGADLREIRDSKLIAMHLARLVPDRPSSEDMEELDARGLMQLVFGRRDCLLLLDNLETPEAGDGGTSNDYKALLPAGGKCRVVATSVDRGVLSQLGVAPRAHLELRELSEREARALIVAQVGEEQVAAEADAVEAIIELTGALPVALRIAARTAALLATPEPFTTLSAALSEPTTRLDEIAEPIPGGEVLRPVLEVALRRLEDEEQRFFAQLGACSGAGFRLATAAAVGTMTGLKARRLLTRLAQAGLVEYTPGKDHFRLHTLLHLLARERAAASGLLEDAEDRHRAYFVDYLRDHGKYEAVAIEALLEEQEAILEVLDQLAERGALEVSLLPGLNLLLEQTGGWDTGRRLMRKAQQAGIARDSWLYGVLELQRGKNLQRQGDHDKAMEAYQASLRIAEEIGDRRGTAMVLTSLGGLYRDRGDVSAGIESLERALELREELGDVRGTSMVLTSLGGLYRDRGDVSAGIESLERALAISEERGDSRQTAMVLTSLGGLYRDRGDVSAGIESLERALALIEELGDVRGTAMVLNSLGGLYRDGGDVSAGIAALERALAISEERGDSRQTAMVLTSLGGLYRDRGDVSAGIESLERALELSEELGDVRGTAMVLTSLGGLYRDRGDVSAGIESLERALELREELGDVRGTAMVLISLGGLYRDQSQLEPALAAFLRSREIQSERDLALGRQTIKTNIKNIRRCLRELEASADEGSRKEALAKFHLRGGQNLSRIADHPGAIIHFQRCLTLSDSASVRGRAHFGLAQTAFRWENHTLAIEHFQAALAHGLNSTLLYATYGRCLHETGAPFEQVAEQFEAALEQDPNNAWASSWFALALAEAGEHAKAQKYARKATLLQPEHSAFLTNLARTLLATGEPQDRREARELLHEADELAPPDSTAAAELIRQIEEESS